MSDRLTFSWFVGTCNLGHPATGPQEALWNTVKERRETGERKSERGESLEGIKLSRDSSSVQRLIIIHYRTCAVCSF